MRNNFIFRLLFLGIFLVNYSLCEAQKIHLILVADSQDPKIGNPSLDSWTFYERITQNVAKYTGLQVVSHKISGANFSKEYLNNQINSLSVGERDVVFFYSSTHGWNDGTNEYPMLILESGNSGSYQNSINLSVIYQQLIQKKGRVTIVLGEACNTNRDSNPKVGPPRSATHPSIEVNEEFVKDLFLRSKLGILACSSRSGQVSVSDKEEGGRFTQAFYSIFEKYTSNNFRDGNPTWQRIMEDVKKKTNSISRELGDSGQEPFYEIKELNNFISTEKPTNPTNNSSGNNTKTKTSPPQPNMGKILPKSAISINQGFASPTTENTKPKPVQPATKSACYNNTTFQSIRIFHRFVETYWKGIDNADLDDARETFSSQIFTEDMKEMYSNLPEKLGVENFKKESDELVQLGKNIIDILEETNAQLENDQFKLKATSKLTLAVTDLNRVIKNVENIKRICRERE